MRHGGGLETEITMVVQTDLKEEEEEEPNNYSGEIEERNRRDDFRENVKRGFKIFK